MTPSNPSISKSANAIALKESKFSAARNRGSTASWCYAKITPAALHCGNLDARRFDAAEAAGPMPEFELSDFSARRRRTNATAVPALSMA
jgi:hypothetical protein